MANGYRELVLTLQNIIYSDSELKYITKERNISEFRIERICDSNTDEISDEATYRNCILIRKSTVHYFQSLGYNLFRQFESSEDCVNYQKPLLRNSDDIDYETYKLVTMLEYSLDIYCYAIPPLSVRRRYPLMSSTIHVSTHTIPTSSESSVDTPLDHNLDDFEYISTISRAVPISSSGYANESVWGSISRLPTALVEPISNTFWNNLSSEELSSSDSDVESEGGGVFVKLATLNSTRRRSNSTSRSSTPDDQTREPILEEDNDHESRNRRLSGESVLFRVVDMGISGEGIVSRLVDNTEMSLEGTVSRRNENPGIPSDDTVPGINGGPETFDEATALMKYFDNTTSDSRVLGCIENVHMDVCETAEVEKHVKEEHKSPGECALSVGHDMKDTYDDIQIKNRRDLYTSIQTNENFSRHTSINKRSSSSFAESSGSSVWCSTEPKQNKLSFDATECRPSHSNSPLELSNINQQSVNNLEPQGSAIQKVKNASSLDNPQNSSSANNQQSDEHRDYIEPFHVLQSSRGPCEDGPCLDQIEKYFDNIPSHSSFDSSFSQNETTNQHTFDQIQTSEVIDINENQPRVNYFNECVELAPTFDIHEDQPLDSSISESVESIHFHRNNRLAQSMARIERTVAFYSFLNQNRITESLQYPDMDPAEASKSNSNAKKHAFLPPLNVPMVWSRKCEDLQYLLSLKLSQPKRYIDEYNRIRKSKFNILDCLRKRETSGVLQQTKVMEVIARPHYNIYPPADEEDIRSMLEDVQGEDEMDLNGYLMVSLAAHRTFYNFAGGHKDKFA